MTVRVTQDRVDAVLASVRALTTDRLLIGVPAENATRPDDGEEPVNNATLAYVHEHGAPEINLPARPFLGPGIEDAREALERRFRQGAMAALNGTPDAAARTLHGAGLMAVNAVVERLTNGPHTPLSPAYYNERLAEELAKTGAPMGPAEVTILVRSGEMRRSITYVIRKRGR